MSWTKVESRSASGLATRGTSRLTEVILPALITVLAVVAGVLHLAHNYLPTNMPADASAGPPAGAPPPGGGSDALMSLVMPHLTEIFVLNFVAYVALGLVFFVVARTRPNIRVLVDVLLVLMSVATLYAWNDFGRSNPYGTGTMALIVELGLIMVAGADALRARAR